jgi:acyl carrier protein
VRTFLARYCNVARLKDGDDLFALGFINSLYAMQLIQFVEKEFGVKVLDADLDLANFRTVDAIAEFVERKTAAR